MNLIAYLMESRGVVNSAQRLPTIAMRFGLSARRMERALNAYCDTAARYGGAPTLAVTANLLERYPRVFTGLARRGAELAIHGYVHTDYSRLDYAEQRAHVERGLAAFREIGIAVTGTRCPYVRWNAESVRVARDLGLGYSSNRTIAWDVLPDTVAPRAREAYRSGLRLYRSDDAEAVPALPSYVDGLLDLPASLPDDEAMVDRLRLRPEERAATWAAVMRGVHELGEMYVLILHHERLRLCQPALEAVLEEARGLQPAVWLATMAQIAAWWRRRAGVRLHIERLEDGRVRVVRPRDADVTVLARGIEAPGLRPWYGPDRAVDAAEVTFKNAQLPAIGVEDDASGALVRFLEEEGYTVRRDVSGGCALTLRGWQQFEDTDKRTVLRRIEQADGPLVRVWRWPRGARAALSLTGDVDSMTLLDFLRRPLEV